MEQKVRSLAKIEHDSSELALEQEIVFRVKN